MLSHYRQAREPGNAVCRTSRILGGLASRAPQAGAALGKDAGNFVGSGCAPRASSSCGSTSVQGSWAIGQRGRNRQPEGIATGLGIFSPDRICAVLRRRGSRSGTTDNSALVYGCCGSLITCRAGPYSTIRPRYAQALWQEEPGPRLAPAAQVLP